MAITMLIVFFAILVLNLVNADNTTDYIHQLEQKISDLESHSKASEQKQAAVLASVLSQLQSQGQEITQLKANLTELENNTSTDSSSVTPGRELVVFEARTSQDITHTGRIHFQQVTRNIGGGFSSSTGVFTAPFSGTYQIWYSVTVGVQHNDNTVLTVTGGAGATIDTFLVYGFPLAKSRHKHMQGVLALSLVKDEKVYLTLNPPEQVDANSSFGGVFLGDM